MSHPASLYWEERARRFCRIGDGLPAVCSYGMPYFYNKAIDLTQRVALRPYLGVAPGAAVLDIGCGVGRWSQMLAGNGARVVGVDLSSTMVEEARRRARAEGLAAYCEFRVGDIAELDLHTTFRLVLGVTVLQHILDTSRFHDAIARIRRHLDADGRAVLLEAAPTDRTTRCNTPVFVARRERDYVSAFEDSQLEVVEIAGVDPTPLKTWLLPYYRQLPRPLALAALATSTMVSLPLDLTLGRGMPWRSWHKVFVVRHTGASRATH